MKTQYRASRLAGLGLLLSLWFGAVTATTLAPDALVRETADRALARMTAERAAFKADLNKLYRMVDEIVLPHFDFERMSQLVLGRHWRDAGPEQRARFTVEFKALLVRTYATALFDYTGQKIVYKPFHAGAADADVVVKTEIETGTGPAVPMHFALWKNGAGDWKVFDVRIDGVSLVTNYRHSYGKTIQTEGFDALIAQLAKQSAATGGHSPSR
jgi:phospholipid transport system substrate-binding protein